MDGMFVPNITIGPEVISSIRRYSKKIFDVHLMINNPSHYIDNFYKAGADIITIHLEADNHPIRTLEYIKSLGIKAGVSINPATNEENLKYLIDYCDSILYNACESRFQRTKNCRVSSLKITSKRITNQRKKKQMVL